MKKIIGWILSILGVLIIFWGIWSSYQIFTAQNPVPEIFSIGKLQENSENLPSTGELTQQQQIQKVIKEQINEMFPPESTSKVFNLISWSIFMFILIAGGGKISTLGIKLLR